LLQSPTTVRVELLRVGSAVGSDIRPTADAGTNIVSAAGRRRDRVGGRE
jgi:hypothetical protein